MRLRELPEDHNERGKYSRAECGVPVDYLIHVTLRDTTSVRQSVRAALSRHERVVLAVSGGLDSMALLDAAAAVMPHDRLTVATFDHGTGPAAVAACALVERCAAMLGVSCVAEGTTATLVSESELRTVRWRFLRRVAAERGAVVCTAHTEDDQVETVLMRVMRDAGARGLAGLYAASDIVRPLVRIPRRTLVRYARSRALTWVEDPSNASAAYLRNRIRGDILPALRRVRPAIDRDLLAIARAAARLRGEIEARVDGIVGLRVYAGGRGVDVPAAALPTRDAGVAVWPAIVARAGVAIDRRGIERLASFTVNGRTGSRVQLSGGWEVVRARDAFELRPSNTEPGIVATPTTLALSEETRWGEWSFRAGDARAPAGDDSWSAWLPSDRPLWVRPWRPGDAMTYRAGVPPRKVKRLLTDAGVTGHKRAGWPVVVAGDQIVWIPGVRRADAATARSGRPGLPFMCEYINR